MQLICLSLCVTAIIKVSQTEPLLMLVRMVIMKYGTNNVDSVNYVRTLNTMPVKSIKK